MPKDGPLHLILEEDCLILIESKLPWFFMNNWRILLGKLEQLMRWDKNKKKEINQISECKILYN